MHSLKLYQILIVFLLTGFNLSCTEGLNGSAEGVVRVPQNLVASPGARTIELSWMGMGNAKSYILYWQVDQSVTSKSQANRIELDATAFHVHRSLNNGVTYHYRVTAITDKGESEFSNQVQATPRQAPPGKPQRAENTFDCSCVRAQGGDRRVTIDWPLDVSAGAIKYSILWQRGAGVSPTTGQRIENISPPFVHSGLVNGQLYSYRLVGINDAGEGTPSDEIVIIPQKSLPFAPRVLSANVSDGQVAISWDEVSNAEYFEIYWSTTPGVTMYSQYISKVRSPYNHAPLFNDRTYYYRVRAINSGGESTLSGELRAVPTASSPVPPNAWSYEAISNSEPSVPLPPRLLPGDGQISLSWNKVDAASGYSIYWDTNPNIDLISSVLVNVAPLEINGQMKYVHTELTNGQDYYYRLASINDAGETLSQSVAGPVQPQKITAGQPANLRAVSGDSWIEVRWSPVQSSRNYVINWSNETGETNSVGSVFETSYRLENLDNGIPYNITIQAIDFEGNLGPESVLVEATPQIPPPTAPTGLEIIAGDAQVTISWSANPVGEHGERDEEVSGYNVYWSLQPGVPTGSDARRVNLDAVTSSTQINHAGLVNRQRYYYVVTAVNAGGESLPSRELWAIPQVPRPGAPTSVSAQAGNHSTTISWNSVDDALAYNIYWQSFLENQLRSNRIVIPNVQSPHTITGLTNNVEHYFKVVAINDGGEGISSAEISSTPYLPSPRQAPNNINVTAEDARTIISWSDPNPERNPEDVNDTTIEVQGYTIYWSTDPDFDLNNAPIIVDIQKQPGVNQYSFAHTELVNGISYYYRVAASNSGGVGPVSDVVFSTPQVDPPDDVPGRFAAIAGDAEVQILWSPDVDSAEYYKVFFSTDLSIPMGQWTLIPGITSDDYHSSLINGLTYYYYIRAVNPGGEGPESKIVSAQPQVPPPAAPTGVTGASGDTKAIIDWDGQAADITYKIYWSTEPGVDTNSEQINDVRAAYVHSNLNNNDTVYYYRLQAENLGGVSPLSQEISVDPAPPVTGAPVGLTAQSRDGQIEIRWLPPQAADTATIYTLLWSTIPNLGINPNSIPNVRSPYTHLNLENGLTYYYSIIASNESGDSDRSSVTQARPLPPVANTPTGLTLESGVNQINITWIPVAGADSYYLYWSNTNGDLNPQFVQLASLDNNYIHQGLDNNLTYYYQISSVNLAGESAATLWAHTMPTQAPNVDPVIAQGTSLSSSVRKGQTISINLSANDLDADTLNWRVTQLPVAGDVTFVNNLSAGTSVGLMYSNTNNNATQDHFWIEVNDGRGGTDIIQVQIIIQNGLPIAQNDSYEIIEGGLISAPSAGPPQLNGLLDNDGDPDGEPLSVHTTPAYVPDHGTLNLNADGSFTYQHNGSEFTTDNFGYQISDGVDTDIGHVTIDVIPINDAPNIVNPNVSLVVVAMSEDAFPTSFATQNLQASDPNTDDTLIWQFRSTDTASLGTPVLVDNGDGTATLDYTPNGNANGVDLFTVEVRDSQGLVDSVRYEVNIAPRNDPPTINSTSFSHVENRVIVGQIEVSDVDGDAIWVTINNGLDKRNFWLNERTAKLTFSDPPNYENPDDSNNDNVYVIEIVANDGTNDSTPTLVSIIVNDIVEDTPLTGLFVDANLQQCIDKEASLKNWKFAEEVSGYLYCNQMGITNLSGVEALTNLEHIYLRGNQISDYSLLGSMPALDEVDLSSNNISTLDATGISNLTNISILWLSYNSINDFRSLESLANIKTLAYYNNEFNGVSDIQAAFLHTLEQVESLWIGGNPLADVSALNALPNLIDLDLSGIGTYSSPSQIPGLDTLNHLKALYLGENGLQTLAGLEQFTELQELGLWTNTIRDISALSPATHNKLVSLSLYGNGLSSLASDVPGLINLNRLKLLRLGENNLTNSAVVELANLTNLEGLQLNKNKISDISPIQSLQKLRTLNVANNQIGNSAMTKAVPLAKNIGAPQNLVAIPNWQNDEITIDWVAETGLTYDILRINDFNNNYPGYQRIYNVTPPHTISNAYSGGSGTMDFYVVAKGGADAATSMTSLKLNRDIENAPTSLYVVPEDSTANIFWTESSMSNSHTLTWYDSSGNQLGNMPNASSGVQVGSLQNGDTYYFKVTAEGIDSDISTFSNSNLQSMEYLYLSNNYIQDISPLNGLGNLRELYLGNNIIIDIDAFQSSVYPNLYYLFLENNYVTGDISLNSYPNVLNIQLQNNLISNISGNTPISSLRNLTVQNNNISNVASLSQLASNLNRIDIGKNNLGDSSVSYAIPIIQDATSPQNISAIGSNHSITVLWEASSDAEAHDITWENTLHNLAGKVTNVTSPVTITGLINRVAYDISVTAVRQNGDITVKTKAVPGKPVSSAPGGFNVEPQDGTVIANWIPPTVSDNLTDYTMHYISQNDLQWTQLSIPANQSSVELNNLNNGELYTFKLTANDAGNSLDTLSSLANVSDLSLANNSYGSIEGLSSIATLESLNVISNKINSIDLVNQTNLPLLTGFSATNNLINDVSAVSTLNNLKRFEIGYNNVARLLNVTDLTSLPLSNLWLFGNNLIDCTDLAFLIQSMPERWVSPINVLPGNTCTVYPDLTQTSAAFSVSDQVEVGTPIEITVQLRDSFGNDIPYNINRVLLEISGANPRTLNTPYSGNGAYVATYTPAILGIDNYRVILSTTTSPIFSPIATSYSNEIVPRAADVSLSTITMQDGPFASGDILDVWIQLFDSSGEPTIGDVAVNITGSNPQILLPAYIANGLYNVQYSPTLEGTDNFELIIDSIPKSGSISRRVINPTPIVAQALGPRHSCALTQFGVVKCWGFNYSGQLGYGNKSVISIGTLSEEMGANLPSLQLGTGINATKVFAGNNFSCVILSDGSTKCWGDNRYGQLGLGYLGNPGDEINEMGDNLQAIDLGVGRSVTDLATGKFHVCALLDNGTVKCWGYNIYGQLGQGDAIDRGIKASNMGDNLPPIDLDGVAIGITAGDFHTCVLLENGTVKCWGINNSGQLGIEEFGHRGTAQSHMGINLPAVDLGGFVATEIAAGQNHTCALSNTGLVKCWGRNSNGQLGQGDTQNIGNNTNSMGNNLHPIDLDGVAISITAGSAHTCALLQGFIVKCWGINQSGQLGLGDKISRGDNIGEMGVNLSPVELGSQLPVTIDAGDFHTCATLDDGSAKCWGDNWQGGLGQGDNQPRGGDPFEMGTNLPPIDLGNSITVDQISASYYHTCAVLTGGILKCWGSHLHGQLGLPLSYQPGDDPSEMGINLQAIDLGIERTAVAISSAGSSSSLYSHNCAILDNGSVKCWGDNQRGQLGLEDTNNRGDDPNEMGDNLPSVDLGSGFMAQEISVGQRHVCTILRSTTVSGIVKCWGGNTSGVLGLGDLIARGDNPNELGDNLPSIDLGADRSAIAIKSSSYFNCVILDTGSVKCWGENGSGQLGQGDTEDRGDTSGEMGDQLNPIDLGFGRTVIDIALGINHACALLDDKSVKCWGDNSSGQLGLGDSSHRGDNPNELGDNLPTVDVGGLPVEKIDAAFEKTCVVLFDGSAKCWGAGVGNNPNEMGTKLPRIDFGSKSQITDVAIQHDSHSTGRSHICALLVNNTMRCIGNNAFGQLGTGGKEFVPVEL